MTLAPQWFWSDTHFGHKNIIDYCNRPFTSVADMNRAMMLNFQAMVSPGELVVWVGDCFFCKSDEAKTILAQLPGIHVLVRGNHDKEAAAMASIGFALVCDQLTVDINGRTCQVSHYPNHKTSSGQLLIHGHTHEKTRREGHRIHVGVDAWGYAPASRGQVGALCQ